MPWDKELEAQKILKKEKEITTLWTKHKDGRTPTPREHVGYAREGAMQSDWYQWAVNSYNEVFASTLAHVPNEGDTGGEAGAIKGGIRAALGVLPGFPDFVCVALWPEVNLLEVKLPGEKLSPAQEKLHAKWAKLGINIELAFDFICWRAWIEDIVKRYYLKNVVL